MPQRTLVEHSTRMSVLEAEDEAVNALPRCLRGPLYIPHIRCCMRLFEWRCLHAVSDSEGASLLYDFGPFGSASIKS